MSILNRRDRETIRRLVGESDVALDGSRTEFAAPDWLVAPDFLLGKEKEAALDSEFVGCLDALADWQRQLGEEARSCAYRRLASALGKFADRFQARIAEIFVDDGEDHLVTLMTHNIGTLWLPKNPQAPARSSIVLHVYRTLRPYFSNDVSKDPYYRDDRPEGAPPTQSQLAVPIIWHERGTDATVWVVNLQSCERGAFNRAQMEELQSAALELLPDLLVLKRVESPGERWLPYHPEVHGDDMVQIAERLCYTLAETVDPHYAYASIWYTDQDRLWVYATSGYDDEYRISRTLRPDGFTGAVTRGAAGSVFTIDPQNDDQFIRKDKARRRGIQRVISTPVYREERDGSGAKKRRCVSALSIYLSHPEKDSLGLQMGLVHTAELFGRMSEEFEQLRLDYMTARQQYLLWEKPLASTSDFDSIRDYLVELFDADGCSVFARPLFEQKLYCVATTGLFGRRQGQGEQDQRVGNPEDAVYDLKFDRGLTVHMANHPGVPLLINNLLDRHDPRAVVKPELIFREDFEPRDDRNRRFLGVGVYYKRSRGGQTETDLLGVIRLLRRPSSKPFTHCDARLLERLAQNCIASFLDWRRVERVSEFGRNRFQASPEVAAWPERRLLRRPIPCVRSTRRLLEEAVRDLHACYARYAVPSCLRGENPGEKVTVRLLVLHEADPKPVFRTHAYYAEPSPEIPLPDALYDAEDDPTLRPMLDSANKGRVFNDTAHAVTVAVAGTVPNVPGPALRMPLRAWSNDGVVHAVLAVDFDASVVRVEWDQSDLLPLLDAAARLCAIWGIADLGERAAEVFDPALPYKGWLWLRQRCGLELGEYSQKISKDQGSAIEDVRFKKWTRFIQDSHRRGETWLPVTPQPLGRLAEAAHLGVERGDGRFCIPMRIGPILSYACVYRDRVRPATADTASADERLKRLIGHACGLWFNLSFLNINTWTAMFEPQTRSSALQIWAGSVQWTALQSSPPIKAICDLADSLTIPIPSPMHGAWIKETEPTSE